MGMKRKVVSDGVLGVETSSDYIGWSFGHPAAEASAEDLERCRLVVRFRVNDLRAPEEGFDDLSHLEKYHYWRGRPGEDALYYQRVFIGGSQLRLKVEGLRGPRPTLSVNVPYHQFIRFRFNNLHSPGYHLTDLVCAELLKRRMAALHCSAFTLGDDTVAVIAPPDTGKTLTTMSAVFDAGAEFLSEDLAIVDDTDLYAVPWTSTFRYYDQFNMSRRLRAWMQLTRIFPPAELIKPPGETRTVDGYIDPQRIKAKGRITYLAILARRPGGVVELEPAEAARLVCNLNRYEFVYLKNPMLVAYSYFNPELDLEALVAEERRILTALTENTTCLLVRSEDPTHYGRLIVEHISQP